jgi:hypothetical protein
VVAPSWWVFVLLALGAFRVTRLVAYDDLTIPLRSWLTGMGDEEHKQWAYVIDHQHEVAHDPWDLRQVQMLPMETLRDRLREATGSDAVPPLVASDQAWPPVSKERYYVSKLVRCPWCAGFWVSLAAMAVWGGWHDAGLSGWFSGVVLALPLSAVVGLLAKNLDA